MRLAVIALSLLLFLCCTKNETPRSLTITDLELQILDSIHHHEGLFSIAFQSLDSSSHAIFINKRAIFHAASTMKTPVMIEVFKQVEDGNLSLDDSLEVTNTFKSIVDSSWFELKVNEDSEQELYQFIGGKVTVGQLVEAMITKSSNLASNILIDKLGARQITETMALLGADQMKVLRGVEDIKAFNLGLSNSTTAQSLMLIYLKLANGEVVSQEASTAMIEVLKRQEFNDVIPAHLPNDVVVAHKTGHISGVQHDSGIVYLPDGRSYVLILLSKEIPDIDKGTRLLQNISKIIYDYEMQKY